MMLPTKLAQKGQSVLLNHRALTRRGFFWSRKAAVNPAAPLIEKEEEMKIMQYRGRIDEFNKNAAAFESYLRD